MREILFRGKRADNEKWKSGLLCKQLDLDGTDELCIQTWDREAQGVSSRVVAVIPSTVGQYTGLTDKNGKKVFEGDILKHFNKPTIQAEAYDIYKVEFDEVRCMFVGRINTAVTAELKKYLGDYYEVIGNIYDNPELLVGKENE